MLGRDGEGECVWGRSPELLKSLIMDAISPMAQHDPLPCLVSKEEDVVELGSPVTVKVNGAQTSVLINTLRK